MILTVTFNPVVDVDFIVANLRPGGRYRADVSHRSPGGGGINISIILSRMGQPSFAMGFLAGFNGAYILDALRREGVYTNFIHTKGETRINVCVIDTERNSETRLHERGIEIPVSDKTAFMRNFERILCRVEMVCMGGSLPPGIDASIYSELVKSAKNNSIPTILYPRTEDLDVALTEPPTVVKLDYQLPRLSTDTSQEKLDSFVTRSRELHRKGTEWVLMSLGKEKAAFSSPKGSWIAEGSLSEMTYVYATEDALLAGMVAAMRETDSPEEIVRSAMACNWECATHPEKFPQSRECVETLKPQVLLSKIG